MNDQDVVASKGKESLKRIHANALALLDLTYTKDDLALLVEDARQGLERKSITRIQESFDLFILDRPVCFIIVPVPDYYGFPRFDLGILFSFHRFNYLMAYSAFRLPCDKVKLKPFILTSDILEHEIENNYEEERE